MDSRSQQGNGEPHYFETNSSSMPDYPTHYSAEPRDIYSARPREASNSRQRRTSPPNKDKMASASDRSEAPDPAGVSPELIATITEKVKKELVEHLKQTGSIDDQPKAPPLQRVPSNRSSSTTSPPPTARRVYTPPSPPYPVKPANASSSPVEPAKSPPSSPLDKPSGVRFSDRKPTSRPSPSRSFSQVELSTVDQKWGRLFDVEGNPTQRLGQFLRGLANHIICDFEPKKSIVITPSKMAQYYADHPLDNEMNPLLSIFRAQSNEQISRLYQDLGCQHHLIQDKSDIVPTVPALTPVGFAHWMTIQLLAYPDEEASRLEKVVLAMPIDSDGEMIDGKPERLPKQISRHLLPNREDRKSRKLVEKAIDNFFEDLGSSSRRKASITPPLSRTTSSQRPSPIEIHQSKPANTTKPIERERMPYAGAPTVSDASSTDGEAIKIERERKPYTAQPGNGKIHAENLNLPSRPSRANSTSRMKDKPVTAERDEPRHLRTQSTASQNYKPAPRMRRPSSPPMKKYSDSVPGDIGTGSAHGSIPMSTSSSFSHPSQPIPSSYGSSTSTSTSFPPPPPSMDIRETRAKRSSKDEPRYRRPTEDVDPRLTSEFSSPRDAERWDRYQESRGGEPDLARYDSRGSGSVDPRDTRGASYEDWYREKGRGAGYDGYATRH